MTTAPPPSILKPRFLKSFHMKKQMFYPINALHSLLEDERVRDEARLGSSQELNSQEETVGWSVKCVLDALLDIHPLLQLQATPRSAKLFNASNSILQRPKV